MLASFPFGFPLNTKRGKRGPKHIAGSSQVAFVVGGLPFCLTGVVFPSWVVPQSHFFRNVVGGLEMCGRVCTPVAELKGKERRVPQLFDLYPACKSVWLCLCLIRLPFWGGFK